MAENRKKTVLMVVLMALPFLVGFFLSYYIWGARGDKPVDYKKSLQETISYISNLEQSNRDLGARVDSLDAEVEVLKQKGAQTSDTNSSTIAALNQQVKALQAENQMLRSRLQGLTSEMNTSRIP